MEKLFFELLQVAVGIRDELSRVPSAVEWPQIMREAERQAVDGVMFSGIERLSRSMRPPEDVLFQWIGMAQLTEGVYQLQRKRARQLTRMFSEAGYPSCVLKGVGVAQLYPNPARRLSGDIDIWVECKGKESGVGREEVMMWLRTRCEIGKAMWHHVDAHLFEDVPVEVHFHPIWLYNPLHQHRLRRFFDQQREVQMKEREEGYNYPTPYFNTVYSLIHTFHHLLEEGIGLRHIVDYYYILRSKEMGDRSLDTDLRDTLRSLGLEKIARAMMWVLQEACGMKREYMLFEPDETEGRFLLSEIMAGGNFGQSRSDGLSRNTLKRYRVMLRHYPSEVLWMIPWKVWHRIWRMRLSY